MSNEELRSIEKSDPVAPKTIGQATVMSIKDWIITILITMIPVVNLVMLFVWAFSKDENPNKSNWAKANLVWMVISIILAVLFFGSIFSLLKS